MTQDRDVLVARVHRGIDAQASIPTGKAKPALASQEPALTLRNGFPGGRGKFTPNYSRITISTTPICWCMIIVHRHLPTFGSGIM